MELLINVCHRYSDERSFRIALRSHHSCTAALQDMERETGFEPASSAWKAEILPLDDSRKWTFIVPYGATAGV
jgi:hypothetical protein